MNKLDRAQYLVNLLAIMESKEIAGRKKGTTLAGEYEKEYDQLIDDIERDNQKEAKHGKGTDEGNETKGVRRA